MKRWHKTHSWKKNLNTKITHGTTPCTDDIVPTRNKLHTHTHKARHPKTWELPKWGLTDNTLQGCTDLYQRLGVDNLISSVRRVKLLSRSKYSHMFRLRISNPIVSISFRIKKQLQNGDAETGGYTLDPYEWWRRRMRRVGAHTVIFHSMGPGKLGCPHIPGQQAS